MAKQQNSDSERLGKDSEGSQKQNDDPDCSSKKNFQKSNKNVKINVNSFFFILIGDFCHACHSIFHEKSTKSTRKDFWCFEKTSILFYNSVLKIVFLWIWSIFGCFLGCQTRRKRLFLAFLDCWEVFKCVINNILLNKWLWRII